MKKFEIINNSLIVTDTETNKIVFDEPKSNVYYNLYSLQARIPYVALIDVSAENDRAITFNCRLADSTDSTLTVFTEATFQNFVRSNSLGFKTASGGSGAETDPIFSVSEASLFVGGDKAKLDTINNKWDITGNSGTNPAANFIGTSDAQELVVRVNNVETARFKDVGKLYIKTLASGQQAAIRVISIGGFFESQVDQSGNGIFYVPKASMFFDNRGATGHIYFRTNGTNTRAIILNTGEFGINTTSPTKQFDINGELRVRTLPTGLSTENILVVNGSGDVKSISPNSRFIDKEVPTGSINGSNVTFTLANTPVSGSEHVYRNGILQESGAGNHYTISGTTITYLTAPLTGDKIRVTYRI